MRIPREADASGEVSLRWRSGRVHLRKPLGQMGSQCTANGLAFALAGSSITLKQLSLILVDNPGSVPAGNQPLEQVFDRALPSVLTIGPRRIGKAGAHGSVLLPGARSHHAAQTQRTTGVKGNLCVGDRRRPARTGIASAAPTHRQVVAAAVSSSERTSPVNGSACPAHAAAGSIAASLRMLSRATSVS